MQVVSSPSFWLLFRSSINKISRFHVKYQTMGGARYLIFSNFLLVLRKFLFWEKDWILGFNSNAVFKFLKVSNFLRF